MEGLGENPPPQIPLFWWSLPAEPATTTRKEGLLDLLQLGFRQRALLIIFVLDRAPERLLEISARAIAVAGGSARAATLDVRHKAAILLNRRIQRLHGFFGLAEQLVGARQIDRRHCGGAIEELADTGEVIQLSLGRCQVADRILGTAQPQQR